VSTATVLYQDQDTRTDRARSEGDELWLPLSELKAVSGWELKPEGVCKDELCVPVPDAHRQTLIRDDQFNLTEFARLIEQPVAHDQNNAVWYFGPAAWEWKSRLTSRAAPDFELPDLSGHRHTLSELKGKKVFLLFWASW
jgi:AhpC/TSA family